MKIQRIHIQIYPQTSIEPKYGEFYLKNEVSAHGLVLLVQLSLRVAPPSLICIFNRPGVAGAVLQTTL